MEHSDRSGLSIPNPSHIRVAICGELPTARDHLLRCGVVRIDQYHDAAEIPGDAMYHLILVYAPQGEGLLNTVYIRSITQGKHETAVPLRLLNEPACNSALIELKSTIRRISISLPDPEKMSAASTALQM